MYEAWNGMKFTETQMRELIEETLQYMRKGKDSNFESFCEDFPAIKKVNGFYSVEDLSDDEVTELFDYMIDSEDIDLTEMDYEEPYGDDPGNYIPYYDSYEEPEYGVC